MIHEYIFDHDVNETQKLFTQNLISFFDCDKNELSLLYVCIVIFNF